MIVGLFRGRCAESINGTMQIFMNLLELMWENKLVGSQLITVEASMTCVSLCI